MDGWTEYRDPRPPRKWVKRGQEIGFGVEYERNEDRFRVVIRDWRGFSPRKRRVIGEYDGVERANAVAEELVGSEELEELLETVDVNLPTQFSY